MNRPSRISWPGWARCPPAIRRRSSANRSATIARSGRASSMSRTSTRSDAGRTRPQSSNATATTPTTPNGSPAATPAIASVFLALSPADGVRRCPPPPPAAPMMRGLGAALVQQPCRRLHGRSSREPNGRPGQSPRHGLLTQPAFITGEISMITASAHPLPTGACDCHACMFGPAAAFPFDPARTYTPGTRRWKPWSRCIAPWASSARSSSSPAPTARDNRCTSTRSSPGR